MAAVLFSLSSLLLLCAACIHLSAGDGDHDDDHDKCATTTIGTAALFQECVDAVVHDFDEETNYAFLPTESDFKKSIEALFYLQFESSALDFTVCNCKYSINESSTLSTPDPHDNAAVAATNLRNKPAVTFIYGANRNSPTTAGLYSFLMLDPSDSPPNGSPARPGLHWLVYDFDGTTLSSGTAAQSYRRPAPDKAKHQYLFLLYKQNAFLQNFKLSDYVSSECSHCSFNVTAFATKNSLVLAGGNWQEATYDNYVAKLRIDSKQSVDCKTDIKNLCSAAQTVNGFWILVVFLLSSYYFI